MTQESEVQVVEPITLTSLVAVEIFTGPQGVEKILADIKAEVAKFTPDVTTVKGRKEIASMAYKCSQSKTMVDGLGKDLVGEWKKQSALVDASRKMFRDEMDLLRDQTRAPLDAWEAAELARVEAETAIRLMNEAHEAALIEDAMRTQAKRIAELEAAATLAAQQAADAAEKAAQQAAAEESAAQAIADRRAGEERIRREAAEKATREAVEAAAALVAKAEKEKADAVAASLKAEADAIEAAAKVERDKKAAVEKAAQEQAAAVAETERKAAALAAQVEADRKAALERDAARLTAEKAEADRKAANVRHQASVNNKALAALVALGIMNEEAAKTIITAIAKGQIPAVTINY